MRRRGLERAPNEEEKTPSVGLGPGSGPIAQAVLPACSRDFSFEEDVPIGDGRRGDEDFEAPLEEKIMAQN